MKPVLVVAAALLGGGCLISPVIPIGGGKSSKQVQHEEFDKLLPAQLTSTRVWKGEVRVAKLRVWADQEYRAQNMRWQHGFDDQLDYVNQVLTPMLGVRLEAEYRSWDHHAPGSTLAEHLDALTREDPGDDVVWVVGLTSALSLVAGSFEQLGVAALEDPHLVVRGHADLEERKAFERAFPDIDERNRVAALEARRRHKTTTVLLHELAHSLGAIHETERDGVMNASYSHRAAQISERNRELMRLTLEDRVKAPAGRDAQATVHQLLAALETEWPGWDVGDRAALIEQLRAKVGAAPASAIAGVPSAALDQFRRAEQLLARGDHGSAEATLEPLLAAYPAHAGLRVLGCRIELVRSGATNARANAACDRAAAMVADPEAAIAVADARLGVGDLAGARATLVAAEARIASLAASAATAAWLALAAKYQALGAITRAELAIDNAGAGPGADRGIAAWARTARVRYGVPRDEARWKLTVDQDGEALIAVHTVIDLANANKLAAATRAALAAEKRWPGLPGLLAARCDIAFRRHDIGAARQLCTRAVAHGGSSWGLYLMGIVELSGGSATATARAIVRLREAIELDPGLGQAWRGLARAYEHANDREALHKLRIDYYARFQTSL